MCEGNKFGTAKKRKGAGKVASKQWPWSAEGHARSLDSLKRVGQRDTQDPHGRVTVGLGSGVAAICLCDASRA